MQEVQEYPVEAERASLREQIAVALAGLVAEAKYVPDDQEDMQEEKITWLRHWEEKTVVLMPLVEQGKVLGVSIWVNTEDASMLAEADDLYEQWTMEEAKAHVRAKQDIQMGEETAVELSDEGGVVKMSHVEVPQPAHKTVAESNKDERPKVSIPPRPSSKMCSGCARMKQGCKKSRKGAGKRAQAGTSAPKAGPSKHTHDDDNNIMEVVKTHGHGKGQAPMHGRVDKKTAMGLLQALGLVRAKAMAAHTANLCLHVCIEQLAEALAKLGVE
ncbi:hypothetical protein F5J12DRAFT_785814 [Pisolithus orientalis]|uniref:uncharacterized protein n=1 Tax=Pisolithus orientalis TaxID=936130 RepID=UPI0022251C96|nr:uncharacterized protein F5J12DRAFT_785814 [Pisolithus orientalis]KAI5994250.1 hypothetical protein F5J12DRAFT_785814 [Pisolithus orientalis]